MSLAITKYAAGLLSHMVENNNFLTASEAINEWKRVRELVNAGKIQTGVCNGGIWDGTEGHIVVGSPLRPQLRTRARKQRKRSTAVKQKS